MNKCVKCGCENLKFEKIKVDNKIGVLSVCCGSGFNELKTDWGLKFDGVIDIDKGDTYYCPDGEIGY